MCSHLGRYLFAQADGGSVALDVDALVASGTALAGPVGDGMTATEAQTLALLASIDPDTLTPREALDALYKLKAVISS